MEKQVIYLAQMFRKTPNKKKGKLLKEWEFKSEKEAYEQIRIWLTIYGAHAYFYTTEIMEYIPNC